MILQEPKVGERNSRNTNHRSRVSTFLSAPGDSVETKSGRGDIYNVVNSCKEKTHLPTHFPELCQPSRSESYFFGPQQSHSNLIFKKNPGEWTAGTRKKSALWKENNSSSNQTFTMIFHPSVGIFTSKQLDIAIPMCSRNKTWRAYSASKVSGDVSFSQGGKCGKKLGNLHGNNERWHGSLGQKIGKNHPGRNFYRLHMCAKKARKEGEVFAV